MKKIILLIHFFSPVAILAQTGFKAVYEYAGDDVKDSVLLSLYTRDYLNGSTAGYARFNVVFNDSMAYTFIGTGRKTKDNVYGKKPKHHDVFYLKNSGKNISYVRHPNPRPWLIEEEVSYNKFIVLQDNIVVGNHTCSRGYFLHRNDTVFALISKDIPQPYGPFGFIGLPGLVLEVYYKKNGLYYTLKKLNEEEVIIRIPQVRTTTWSEYRKASR